MATTITALDKTKSPALCRFIAAVRAVVQSEDDSARIGMRVAELLKPHLGDRNFLNDEQLEPSEHDYCSNILHVEPDGSFSIVALVWLPGQATPIHDHVSWCVVGVHTGQEHETIYQVANGDSDAHLVVTGTTINPRGSVAALVPPGDIHHVANEGDTMAVSVHVYGADIATLGSSIRRRYDLEVRANA